MIQGDIIKENAPITLPNLYECRVQADRGTRKIKSSERPKPTTGKPKEIEISLYCYDDPNDIGAPMYMNSESHYSSSDYPFRLMLAIDTVRKLANLKADLKRLRVPDFEKTTGDDGKRYYKMDYGISVRILSASLRCEFMYKGKSYGIVEPDYA